LIFPSPSRGTYSAAQSAVDAPWRHDVGVGAIENARERANNTKVRKSVEAFIKAVILD
jgi:hypothetical protein